jgi:hypothetical protein
MGDLQRSLVIMLGEKGCNVQLLRDANGQPVDKMGLMFLPSALWNLFCYCLNFSN